MKVLTLLLAVFHPVDNGIASRYGYPGDRYETSGDFACKNRLLKTYGAKQWLFMKKHGVAHRTLPCGTELKICRASSANWCTHAFVVDRGPFGTLDEKGHWHRRSELPSDEHWKCVVDLLPGPAKELKISGLAPVVLWNKIMKTVSPVAVAHLPRVAKLSLSLTTGR